MSGFVTHWILSAEFTYMNSKSGVLAEVDPMPSFEKNLQIKTDLPFEDIVSGLVAHIKELWWSCDSGT
jgi:hypothetical protein